MGLPGASLLRIKGARVSREMGDDMSMTWIQDFFRRCEAKDPCDKVYAFLSLESPAKHGVTRIVPDYNKTADQVYTDAAWYIINSTHDLSLLTRVEDRQFRKTPNLPSWVPDYVAPCFPTPLVGEKDMQLFPEWHASNQITVHRPKTTLGRMLELEARFIDRIVEVASPPSKNVESDSLEIDFTGTAKIALATPPGYPHAHAQTRDALSSEDRKLIEI